MELPKHTESPRDLSTDLVACLHIVQESYVRVEMLHTMTQSNFIELDIQPFLEMGANFSILLRQAVVRIVEEKVDFVHKRLALGLSTLLKSVIIIHCLMTRLFNNALFSFRLPSELKSSSLKICCH